MRVLVVTAVPAERDAVTRAFTPGAGDVDVIACGVGPAASAAGTATRWRPRPAPLRAWWSPPASAAASATWPRSPPSSDADAIVAGDLGAETPDGYVPVTALGFGTVEHLPPASLVRAVAGATGAVTGTVQTVSTVTGSAARAAELCARHPYAAAEAMEGFGVAEAAALHGVPVLEIRAVSNAVGPRDRAAWRIKEALEALTGAFGKLAPVLEGWEDRNEDRDEEHDDV